MGRWKKVPGNGRCSGLVSARVLGCVRVLLSVGGRCRPAARRTGCHTQTWKGVSLTGDGRNFQERAGARVYGGCAHIAGVLVACSGIWACAHVGRIVRVDVAVGELHVIAVDVEAAALPEERRSLSEGSRKVLPSGRWEKVPGNGRCSGSVSARVLGCMRVLLSVGGWCRPAARRTPCHTQTREGVSSGGRWKKLPGNDRCSGYVGARVLGVCAVFGF